MAVLVLSPPSPGDRLRAAAAGSARALAAHLEASVNSAATAADAEACQAAKRELLNAFASTPYRPVGLATADQGLASVVQLLEWCTALIADATDGHPNLSRATPPDRDLFGLAAVVLGQTGDLLAHPDSAALPDPAAMDRQREASAAYHRSAALDHDYDAVEDDRQTNLSRAGDRPRGAGHRGGRPDRHPAGRPGDDRRRAPRLERGAAEGTMAERRVAAISGAMGVLVRHASFRSVWFLNSLRGSLALAAAVLVADLSGVQHAFWVVLGTLSVLRTNAASTESTALRALGGTVAGFVLGALLLLGIGTSTPALWAALPIAVAVAAYAPGTLPFAFGQAAFTIVGGGPVQPARARPAGGWACCASRTWPSAAW